MTIHTQLDRADGREGRRLGATFILLCLVSAAFSPAAGKDFLVFNTADLVDVNPGDGICDADASAGGIICTLRAAIMEANALPGADTIRLNPGTYTLSIAPIGLDNDSKGDLDVLDDLTLEGGAGRIVDGGDVDRVFSIVFSEVTIRDLEIRNGTSTNGGCLFAGAGSDLLLERVRIFDCESPSSRGGGLHILIGEATLRDVWIDGNTAREGAGLHFGGSRLLLERTTVSNNFSVLDGGGLNLVANRGIGGDVALVNSTIRGNIAARNGGALETTIPVFVYSSALIDNVCSSSLDTTGLGGGIHILGGSVQLANSVVARNRCGFFIPFRFASDCVGSLNLAGFNLVGWSGGCTISGAGAGDLLGGSTPLEPLLGDFGPLAGPTPGHSPLVGSPLINAGDPTGCRADRDGDGPGSGVVLAVDQQGLPRVGQGRCDIGPVEVNPIFADGFESGNINAWSSVP